MSMRMNMERRMAHIKVGIERVPRDTMGNLFTAKKMVNGLSSSKME